MISTPISMFELLSEVVGVTVKLILLSEVVVEMGKLDLLDEV